MKETNLNIFYQLGASLEQMRGQLTTGTGIMGVYPFLFLSQDWLIAFLKETEELRPDLKDTRQCVRDLSKTLPGTPLKVSDPRPS